MAHIGFWVKQKLPCENVYNFLWNKVLWILLSQRCIFMEHTHKSFFRDNKVLQNRDTHILIYFQYKKQSSCKLFFWLKLRIRIWVFINKYLFARISALNSCCISWVANLANLNFYISPVCEACFNSFYPASQPKIHSLQPEMLQEIILWIWTKRKNN